jgi:hypothetical protein
LLLEANYFQLLTSICHWREFRVGRTLLLRGDKITALAFFIKCLVLLPLHLNYVHTPL